MLSYLIHYSIKASRRNQQFEHILRQFKSITCHFSDTSEHVLITNIFHVLPHITYITAHTIYVYVGFFLSTPNYDARSTTHQIYLYQLICVVGVCYNSTNFHKHTCIHNTDEFCILKGSLTFLVSMKCNVRLMKLLHSQAAVLHQEPFHL